MRNRMYFGDLLVTREIKALDSAWEEFVGKLYLMAFNAASDTVDVEKRSDYMLETIDEIERARVLYLEERTRLKGKFSKREEESEVEDDEAFRVASGGSRWPKEVGEELFGKKSFVPYVKENSEAFSDPLIVDDLVGEKGDEVKKARGFIFNEHPDVKEKVSDGLEEFLRRTLKEEN